MTGSTSRLAGLVGASGYLMDSWLKGHTKVRFLAEMIAAMEMGLAHHYH